MERKHIEWRLSVLQERFIKSKPVPIESTKSGQFVSKKMRIGTAMVAAFVVQNLSKGYWDSVL